MKTLIHADSVSKIIGAKLITNGVKLSRSSMLFLGLVIRTNSGCTQPWQQVRMPIFRSPDLIYHEIRHLSDITLLWLYLPNARRKQFPSNSYFNRKKLHFSQTPPTLIIKNTTMHHWQCCAVHCVYWPRNIFHTSSKDTNKHQPILQTCVNSTIN